MTTVLGWALFVSTALLALAFGCATLFLIVLAIRRKRTIFFILAAGSLSLGILATLANPIANIFIFDSAAEGNAKRMYNKMGERPIEGMSREQLTESFGSPRTITKETGYELWYYDPNPWYMIGWTEIGVRIETNRVVSQWLED